MKKYSVLWMLFYTSTVAFSTFSSFSAKSCPSGWVRFNNYCYFVKGNIRSLDQALSYCYSLGAGLVKINGAEESDFVLDLSKQVAPFEKVWIELK